LEAGPDIVLQPGTIGWTVDDLNDPAIGSLWDEGRYEILDGILTVMPPAYFRGASVADNLKFILRTYFNAVKIPSAFSGEVDIAITPKRVVRADSVAIAGDDLRKFDALKFDPPRTNWRDHELILPPTIVIESVIQGHEAHDHVTKRKWYAEFRIPHYWIVDGTRRTLECLRLDREQYVVDVAGKQKDILSPSSFPGLTIRLNDVWEE
jgi:Uma2 family endonuclease